MRTNKSVNGFFLFKMAWKNLFRHGKRTLITAGAIASGLAIFLFIDSWLLGMEMDSQRNLRLFETASARIYQEENFASRQRLRLTHVIENPQEVLELLEDQGFQGAPRISFMGDLTVFQDPYPSDGNLKVFSHGIDLEKDQEVFALHQYLAQGRYPEKGEFGILLGSWIARELGAQVGYPLTLLTRTREGYFQTMDLVVTGILDTPNPLVNRSHVYLPLDIAAQELQMEGLVTEINIAFPPWTNTEHTVKELQDILRNSPELQVYSWEELAADFLALADTKSKGTSLVLFMVFLIAAVGISNTMLMAIMERVRELGTLRAIGMRNRDIAWLFTLEAGGIGLIGSLMGLGFGSILIAFVTHIGIDFGALLGDMDFGYRVTGVMYGTWNPQGMVLAFLVGILMAAGVAFLPTRRALRSSITDCLRRE